MTTKTSYNFNELPPEVQQKIIEKHREEAISWEIIDEDIMETFRYTLPNANWPADDIHYMLDNYQGSGASFTGRIEDDKIIEILKQKTKFPPHVKKMIEYALQKGELSGINLYQNSNHYYHSGTMKIGYDWYGDPEFEYVREKANELMDLILEEAQNFADELKSIGYKIIDEQTSDEAIKDFLESNEYKFDKEGCIL